jgi:hypothetical protein
LVLMKGRSHRCPYGRAIMFASVRSLLKSGTLERGLVDHLGGINEDLERRARLRGMLPK